MSKDYKEAERQAGLSNKQKKREAKERDPNKKPVRSLHHIDDDEYNARLEAAEREEEAEAAEREDKAPAPLKEDEQSDYRKKK